MKKNSPLDILGSRQRSSSEDWKDARCLTSPLRPHFTADSWSAEMIRKMREVCEGCPVRQRCATEARGASAGFWAGQSHNRYGGTTERLAK